MNELLRMLLGAGLALTEAPKREKTRERLTDRLDEMTDEAARTYNHAVDRIGRLYRRARGEDHRRLVFLASFVAGAGIGAAAGVLLAPMKGSEMREAIADKVQRVQSDLRTRLRDARPSAA